MPWPPSGPHTSPEYVHICVEQIDVYLRYDLTELITSMSRARRIGLPLLNFCQSTSCVPSQVGGSYPTPSFPGPSGTRTWSQWRHTKIQHYDILHLYLHLIVLSPLPSSISREEDWTYPFQINKISPVYKRSKVFTSMLGLISTVMCVGFQLLVALAVPKPHWKLVPWAPVLLLPVPITEFPNTPLPLTPTARSPFSPYLC